MNKALRKAVIAGNWKMNKTPAEARELISAIAPLVKDAGCEVIACTPFVDLTAAQEASGLHPTLDSLHTPLRPKALSFEQSAFLKNYRNNMLDLQSTAAQATAARTRQTLAAGSSDPAVAEVAALEETVNVPLRKILATRMCR